MILTCFADLRRENGVDANARLGDPILCFLGGTKIGQRNKKHLNLSDMTFKKFKSNVFAN